ncbi:MAG: hypothetical protein ACLFWB_09245 [Armatimonadota bacterium]
MRNNVPPYRITEIITTIIVTVIIAASIVHVHQQRSRSETTVPASQPTVPSGKDVNVSKSPLHRMGVRRVDRVVGPKWQGELPEMPYHESFDDLDGWESWKGRAPVIEDGMLRLVNAPEDGPIVFQKEPSAAMPCRITVSGTTEGGVLIICAARAHKECADDLALPGNTATPRDGVKVQLNQASERGPDNALITVLREEEIIFRNSFTLAESKPTQTYSVTLEIHPKQILGKVNGQPYEADVGIADGPLRVWFGALTDDVSVDELTIEDVK